MPTHHPHPPHSVPLTLATAADRTLGCEKRQLEKMLKSYQKKEGYVFPTEPCECLGLYVITLPRAPPTTPDKLPFAIC